MNAEDTKLREQLQRELDANVAELKKVRAALETEHDWDAKMNLYGDEMNLEDNISALWREIDRLDGKAQA